MINFTDKEIEYLKGQVKEYKDFISTEEFRKEFGCVEMDAEDIFLLEKYSNNDIADWSNVNTYENINKDIENICWGILGMATYWLLHGDFEYVLDITGDKQYAEIYRLIGGEEDW